VGPRAGLDDVEKILGPTGSRTPAPLVQPVDNIIKGIYFDNIPVFVISLILSAYSVISVQIKQYEVLTVVTGI
jgi:hypothetical protein